MSIVKKKKGMSLRQVNNANPKTINIPWYDFDNEKGEEEYLALPEAERETLDIVYSREKYTPKLERSMRDQIESGLPGNMLATMLATVLMDWEVYHYNDDETDESELVLTSRDGAEPELRFKVGEKIPVNPRTLDQMINIAAQAKIVEAITGDNRPKLKNSGNSSNTF